jgi:hypothetical protein
MVFIATMKHVRVSMFMALNFLLLSANAFETSVHAPLKRVAAWNGRIGQHYNYNNHVIARTTIRAISKDCHTTDERCDLFVGKEHDCSMSETKLDFAPTVNAITLAILTATLAVFAVTTPLAALAVSGGGLDYSGTDISGQDFSGGTYNGKDFTQGMSYTCLLLTLGIVGASPYT